jgi:solute carrier family 50 protein (sugar transporter)
MSGNCLGWIAYSFLRQNPFVLVGNAPGFIVSIWLNLTAVKLIYQNYSRQKLRQSMPMQRMLEKSYRMSIEMASAPIIHLDDDGNTVYSNGNDNDNADKHVNSAESQLSRSRTNATDCKNNAAHDDDHDDLHAIHIDIDANEEPVPAGMQHIWEQTLDLITLEKAPVAHEYMVIGILSVWLLALSLIAFIPSSTDVKSTTVGFIVNGNLLFFYGGPLSTMVQVLKTRDSSSIHRRTMVMNTLNGAFWTAYGIGIMDYFMFVPNGIGTLMGVVQFALCIIFPAKTDADSTSSTNGDENSTAQRNPLEEQAQEANNAETRLDQNKKHHVKIAKFNDSPAKSNSTIGNSTATGVISLETVDM